MKFVDALPWTSAPRVQVDVELLEPRLQVSRALERPLLLPLLQDAAVEQIPLDRDPIQPNPRVDVLQLAVAGLVGVLELQRVEIHGRQALADYVHSVQVIHGEQPRVALRHLGLDGMIDEVLVHDPEGADVRGIIGWRRPRWPDAEGRIDDTLHFLLCDGALANIVQMLHQRHLLRRQLLRQQAVPGALPAVAVLLPRVEEKDLAVVRVRRRYLCPQHVGRPHGLEASVGQLPRL
mmetsp:Transcript_52110/g.158267  ORF Transcript_52110/g.158267 Transcript_52110/m.158267 type:complete len:235 (+) Transcript_52110:1096-1800(+)